MGEKGTTMKKIAEARDVAQKTTKVEEEAVATEEIAAMPATLKCIFKRTKTAHERTVLLLLWIRRRP